MFAWFGKKESKIDPQEEAISNDINNKVSLFIQKEGLQWGRFEETRTKLDKALNISNGPTSIQILDSLVQISTGALQKTQMSNVDTAVLELLHALKAAKSDPDNCLRSLHSIYNRISTPSNGISDVPPPEKGARPCSPGFDQEASREDPLTEIPQPAIAYQAFSSTPIQVYPRTQDAFKNHKTTLENMASKLQNAPMKYKLTGIALSTIIAATLLATALTVMTGGIAAAVAIVLAIVIALVPPIFVAGGIWDNKRALALKQKQDDNSPQLGL